jgi:phage tail sheath protein FI
MRELYHPGVYREELSPPLRPGFRTAVPAFLGDLPEDKSTRPAPRIVEAWKNGDRSLRRVTGFSQFLDLTGGDGELLLREAVRGFFQNGGDSCFVAPAVFPDVFAALDATDSDLLCWPELTVQPSDKISRLQQMLVTYCDDCGDKIALLDSLPRSTLTATAKQAGELHGTNAALYFPWLQVRAGPPGTLVRIPPCGHVAGVYARTDRKSGVYRAPANEELEGVHDLDLESPLTDTIQDQGDPGKSVNCIRSFPGRGIRVWGARTISRGIDSRYVSVRRLFTTLRRWINTMMADVIFEPNDARLQARIRRELNAYLESVFLAGGLRGERPEEAFYVRCDAVNNIRSARDVGRVVVEVGLAPSAPTEFIVARLVFGPTPRGEELNLKET